jgi:PIN domain nuclease of toxin-antitoxin system
MAPDFDAPLEDFKEFNHRDPFDRLLIAQAIALGCPLLSADPLFSAYPVECIWK